MTRWRLLALALLLLPWIATGAGAVQGTAVWNSASINAFNADVQSDSASFLIPKVDLALQMDAVPPRILEGTTVTYELTVENKGALECSELSTSSTMPTGTSFSSSPDGCFENAGMIECGSMNLPPSTATKLSYTLSFPMNVTSPLESMAQTSCVDPEVSPGDNTSSTSVVVDYSFFFDGFESGSLIEWSSSSP